MVKVIKLLVSIICYAQVIIITGCNKNTAPREFTLQESFVEDSAFIKKHFASAGYILISPYKSDTGIDVNSGIVVIPNTIMSAKKILISSIVVVEGDSIVPGVMEGNDTIATFTPNLNLKPSTTYEVQVMGQAYLFPDELAPSAVSVDESWSFTTAGTAPVYDMSRRTTQVTDFARDGSKMVQVGDYLYLYGGWTGGGSWNDIYRSHDDLSAWEKMPDAPWVGRHTFGLDKLGANVFVYGGDYNNPLFDVWSSRDGLNFNKVATDLNSTVKSRLVYGSCVHNGKLFVMGGQFSFLYSQSGMNDVWSSPNGRVWTKVADNLSFLGKNISGSVASFNGKIWVIGGGYYGEFKVDSAEKWTNHVYSSPDGVTWTREPDAPWTGRQYLDVGVWDNKLWMIGGHRNGNLSDIWYMSKDGTWTEFTPPNLFTARHATAVAVYNNQLVLACGNMNNECWVIARR